MKQYTSKDQTAKLIELGFPKPKFSFPVEDNKHPDYVDEDGNSYSLVESYSIGELIEFLPSELDMARRTIIDNEVLYCDEYKDWIERRFNQHKEIIDNLFDACVTLKEEGVI